MATTTVDLGPLYGAADTLAQCAAQVRVQQVVVGVQSGASCWFSPAAFFFREHLDELVAELSARATQLDQFAEQVRRIAAALQIAAAVRH